MVNEQIFKYRNAKMPKNKKGLKCELNFNGIYEERKVLGYKLMNFDNAC
jgi:hypothetical protein